MHTKRDRIAIFSPAGHSVHKEALMVEIHRMRRLINVSKCVLLNTHDYKIRRTSSRVKGFVVCFPCCLDTVSTLLQLKKKHRGDIVLWKTSD